MIEILLEALDGTLDFISRYGVMQPHRYSTHLVLVRVALLPCPVSTNSPTTAIGMH